MKKLLLLFIVSCPFFLAAQCLPPTQLAVFQVTQNSAVFSWTSTGPWTNFEVITLPAGSPAPTSASTGMIISSVPFVVTGLNCQTEYSFYVRQICGTTPPEEMSLWVGPMSFATMSCQGNTLPPIQQCDTDGDGIEMFNLTMYEMEYLSMLPAGDYTFSYHLSEADAHAEMNPLPVMFPSMMGVQLIFVRAENNATGEYELFVQTLILNEAPQIENLPAMQVCDNNGDGIETFNIYQTTQYIYSTYGQNPNSWSVFYYLTEADAQAQVNPIWNTEIYTNMTNPQYLYVGIVNNQTGCMSIEPLLLQAVECTGISMTAFLDLDNDGIRDSGEPLFPYGDFTYDLNEGATVSVQSPGEYAIYDAVTANTYDIGFSVAADYASAFTVSPASYDNIAITGTGMQQFYFAVSAAQTINDLSVTLVPSQAPRPGFSYTNTIVYSNHGTTVASGTVSFVHDPLVTITNVSQTGITSNAQGFTYDFTGLLPFQSRMITVTMQVPTIPVVTIGNQLINSVSISSAATDVVPADNNMTLSQTIVGSYDPNDKAESHGGKIVFSEFGPDDYLHYTIRFENTGTAEAINIQIEDMLDSSLDASSVRMLAASHFYSMQREGNQLTWNFNNVMLPPTIEDPVGSHGYVTFKVKPMAGYEVGDIIPNYADIYFDFNPAIVTNVFETEFVTSLATESFTQAKALLHPNPAQTFVNVYTQEQMDSVEVYSITGSLVLKTAVSGNETTVDISTLQSGMYLIKISGAEFSSTQKLLKN